jgi:hypothetical protein
MLCVFENGAIVYDVSTLTEEEKSRAVVVSSLPEPEQVEGKIPLLRANKLEERVYYAYVDKQLPTPTQEDYLLDLDFRVSMIELGF